MLKLSVVGSEIVMVDLETGEFSGKTYNAKDWIKRNFNAKWNKDKKVWVADPEVIKEELKNELEEFKKIKQEMKQLGFETLKDYMEFLDYQQSKHI